MTAYTPFLVRSAIISCAAIGAFVLGILLVRTVTQSIVAEARETDKAVAAIRATKPMAYVRLRGIVRAVAGNQIVVEVPDPYDRNQTIFLGAQFDVQANPPTAPGQEVLVDLLRESGVLRARSIFPAAVL